MQNQSFLITEVTKAISESKDNEVVLLFKVENKGNENDEICIEASVINICLSVLFKNKKILLQR